MSTLTWQARHAQKTDTSTSWNANNPILLNGEIGIESDTGKIKIGNGSAAWKLLEYELGTKVPENAKFTDTIYSHPTTSGNKHIPSGGTSGQILRWSADGTATWGADNNTTYGVATSSENGLMSSTDKVKLNAIPNTIKQAAQPTAQAIGDIWLEIL